jgi:hypothetical protein
MLGMNCPAPTPEWAIRDARSTPWMRSPSAIARSRISVTPLHLDLTHHGSLDGLRQRDFERVLRASVG